MSANVIHAEFARAKDGKMKTLREKNINKNMHGKNAQPLVSE